MVRSGRSELEGVFADVGVPACVAGAVAFAALVSAIGAHVGGMAKSTDAVRVFFAKPRTVLAVSPCVPVGPVRGIHSGVDCLLP